MEYKIIPTELDLNDPEEGFTYSSHQDRLIISLVDWRAKRIQLSFENVFKFCHTISDQYHALPPARFVEITDSMDIRQLIADRLATVEDQLRHFVISTNLDEWFEVIASGYDLKIEV